MHQQVQQRRQFLAPLVQRAIRDRAVGQGKRQIEPGFIVQRSARLERRQRAGHAGEPLDLPAHVIRRQPSSRVMRSACAP
jgi:hypothetical protein